MKKRADALTNSLSVDQLCDLIVSKLVASNCLLSSGSSVRIRPGMPSKLRGAIAEARAAIYILSYLLLLSFTYSWISIALVFIFSP